MKLSDILDAMPNSVTSTDLCFMSIKEANQAIEGPSGKLGGGGYYRRVAEYVLDEGNGVFGTVDEHFNFITAYLSRGDYFTALRLSTHALKTYPHGVDLLSCALRAAAGCGRFDLCQSYLEQAEQIPRRYWGWRLFFFAIEYYQSYLESCDLSQIEETLDKALAMAHDYQDYFPTDERGYDKEAELCLFANRRDDAQRILEHAVFGMVDAGDGVRTSIVAAQCCVTLLEKVLADSTDYRLIIKIAQRGIRNTTQKQPSVRIGYFVYREALAQDALICDAQDRREGFGNLEKVRDALMSYRCAYDLLDDADYRSTIERRYSILCHKSGIFDMPLVEGKAKEPADE